MDNPTPLRDVLVVDDDDTIRDGLALYLRHTGLMVDTASTGREALDLLEHATYAVMLLDYQMPEMNGLGVVEALRERAVRPIVLMMTGFHDIAMLPIDGTIVQAVLRKPFSVNDVTAIILGCVAEIREAAGSPLSES